jgi:hypothetical protein
VYGSLMRRKVAGERADVVSGALERGVEVPGVGVGASTVVLVLRLPDLTLTLTQTSRLCFSICLLISHSIITKFYTCHLVVSINIFHTFFE